jgi:hypothetical protein
MVENVTTLKTETKMGDNIKLDLRLWGWLDWPVSWEGSAVVFIIGPFGLNLLLVKSVEGFLTSKNTKVLAPPFPIHNPKKG